MMKRRTSWELKSSCGFFSNSGDRWVKIMAKTCYRLQRFLRQAQLLLLFLGVAYIMAGSLLLLQRSNVALFQKGTYPPSSIPSVPLPPRSLEAPSVSWHHRRPGSTLIQDAENNPDLSGSRVDQESFVSRNLKIRHLRRHWIQRQRTDQENLAEHNPLNRNTRHKGMTWIMLKCSIWTCCQYWLHIILLRNLHWVLCEWRQTTCAWRNCALWLQKNDQLFVPRHLLGEVSTWVKYWIRDKSVFGNTLYEADVHTS